MKTWLVSAAWVLVQFFAPSISLAHGDDAQQIAAVMKKQFDRPDAPLLVEPITVQGVYAVAGWTQGGKGGRALLQKHKDHWLISVCAGNGLTKADVLQTTGMSAAVAQKLALAVNAAEARQTPEKRKLWDSFDGMVKIDPGKAHGDHTPPGVHGANHTSPKH
jgi:hypothetical protein